HFSPILNSHHAMTANEARLRIAYRLRSNGVQSTNFSWAFLLIDKNPTEVGTLNAVYLRPCAIFSASGNARKRNIEITPNSGPGARITKAYRQPTSRSTRGINSIENVVNRNPRHV